MLLTLSADQNKQNYAKLIETIQYQDNQMICINESLKPSNDMYQ
jgi:hypothetical protein